MATSQTRSRSANSRSAPGPASATHCSSRRFGLRFIEPQIAHVPRDERTRSILAWTLEQRTSTRMSLGARPRPRVARNCSASTSSLTVVVPRRTICASVANSLGPMHHVTASTSAPGPAMSSSSRSTCSLPYRPSVRRTIEAPGASWRSSSCHLTRTSRAAPAPQDRRPASSPDARGSAAPDLDCPRAGWRACPLAPRSAAPPERETAPPPRALRAALRLRGARAAGAPLGAWRHRSARLAVAQPGRGAGP